MFGLTYICQAVIGKISDFGITAIFCIFLHFDACRFRIGLMPSTCATLCVNGRGRVRTWPARVHRRGITLAHCTCKAGGGSGRQLGVHNLYLRLWTRLLDALAPLSQWWTLVSWGWVESRFPEAGSETSLLWSAGDAGVGARWKVDTDPRPAWLKKISQLFWGLQEAPKMCLFQNWSTPFKDPQVGIQMAPSAQISIFLGSQRRG